MNRIRIPSAALGAVTATMLLLPFAGTPVSAAGASQSVPVVLPHPNTTPLATDKPVKVYILSGQFNMVGFGRVSGSAPVYPSIYLSADPSVIHVGMHAAGHGVRGGGYAGVRSANSHAQRIAA